MNRNYVFLIFLLVFISLYLVEWQMGQPVIAPAIQNGDLSETEDKSIKYMVDLTELIMNWSLGLIAATVALYKGVGSIKIGFTPAIFVVLSALSSLFFGHLVIDFVVLKLTQSQLPTIDLMVIWARRMQYGLFLFGLFTVLVSSLSLEEGNA